MRISDSACRCIVLATGAAGQVSTCPDCGTIHVSMPQMSLRLRRDTFEALAGLVASARCALDGATTQPFPDSGAGRALH